MIERAPWGVADGWWGVDGSWHDAHPETRAALERAQGADEHRLGPPEEPVWFVTAGDAAELRGPAQIELDGGAGTLRASGSLPPDLPMGAHLLHPDDGGPTTRLFVVAATAPRLARGWGWSAQVYGLRSRHSWGHGDLVDLGSLAAWAGAQGASLVAHNPIGATIPLADQQPSPYFASSRRFWSPLYLRVESVLGAELAIEQVEAAARAGRELDANRRIDRDAVWQLKLDALEHIWEQVRGSRTVREALVADDDAALTVHATYCALAEHHGAGWSRWPAGHRHPAHAEVESFREANRDRVDFWRWLHLECEVQLEHAASAGAGLMGDLPVGFDPDGSDAWADQDLLALGCRIGAPPDDLGPDGQDWGLPPYVPWKLRAAGYAPWLDTLRRSMRHATALRVDHVMGLFRLYWIPPEAPASAGAYVYQYGAELLQLAVTEAARCGTALVGEDLGTVEPEVRAAMAERDVFGYRVGWFDPEPPGRWPSSTLGTLTTHDLPTVAGMWTGADEAMRSEAGVTVRPADEAAMRARLVTIARHGDLEDPEGSRVEQVSDAAHRALAAAGSDLVLATLEDAVGVRERPNLPGTVEERPNWRLALPVSVEELDRSAAPVIAAAMREARGAPGTEDVS
jgi:4-alpha-glucanotransferase